ncbi:hypothetical protein AURDEDRAFT_178410, partial [Auricularia subglabra TFB-10046 SS5]
AGADRSSKRLQTTRPSATSIVEPSDAERRPSSRPPRLCPYCDQALAENLSDTFEDMLLSARAKSWRTRRAANPGALKAPFSVTANVCERHRFEAKMLPRALRLGWPTAIDFDALPARVRAHRPVLDFVLADPSAGSFRALLTRCIPGS